MTLPMTRDVHPMTPNLPLTLIFTQQHIRKNIYQSSFTFSEFCEQYTVIYSIHVLLSIEILIKNSWNWLSSWSKYMNNQFRLVVYSVSVAFPYMEFFECISLHGKKKYFIFLDRWSANNISTEQVKLTEDDRQLLSD